MSSLRNFSVVLHLAINVQTTPRWWNLDCICFPVAPPRKYRLSIYRHNNKYIWKKEWCHVVEKHKSYSPTSVYQIVTHNKGIHLNLPPTLWAEFLSQCEDISLIIWFSGPDCDSHLKGKSKNLQYVRVQIFSQILDICWVYSIQFFIFISKI